MTSTPTPDCVTSYSAAVLSVPHLIAYWRLEETAGAIAFDAGPNHFDGAISGPLLGVPGPIALEPSNNAMDWDTSGDVVSIPHNPKLNADYTPGGHAGFGVEVWLRPTTWNDWDTVVMKAGNGFDTGWGIGHLTTSLHGANDVRFWIERWNDCGYAEVSIPTGQWTHLVATWDGVTDLRLYTNGSLAGSGTFICGLNNNLSPLLIGHGAGTGCSGSEQCSFSGRIDEVAVYDDALTPIEVKDHYYRATSPCGAP